LDHIWIYVDESCLGNQFTERANPGGAAGLLEFWQVDGWLRRDYWLSEPATTNNRMAIRSATFCLGSAAPMQRRRLIRSAVPDPRHRNGSAGGNRGWTRKAGKIENLELWQELVNATQPHHVSWQWVRGHAGHPQNEYANHLATRAAREQSCSPGLVPSGFEAWLQQQREERDRYLDFVEHAPPS
jgi:ribonuclease HI